MSIDWSRLAELAQVERACHLIGNLCAQSDLLLVSIKQQTLKLMIVTLDKRAYEM